MAEFEQKAGTKKCEEQQQEQQQQQQPYDRGWGRGAAGKGGVYTLPASFFLPSSSLEGTVTTTDFLICQQKPTKRRDKAESFAFSKQLEWEHGRYFFFFLSFFMLFFFFLFLPYFSFSPLFLSFLISLLHLDSIINIQIPLPQVPLPPVSNGTSDSLLYIYICLSPSLFSLSKDLSTLPKNISHKKNC